MELVQEQSAKSINETAFEAARKHGASPTEAADVAQEVTMKMLEKLKDDPKVREIATARNRFSRYIEVAARNKHFEFIRRERSRDDRHRRFVDAPEEPLPNRPGVIRQPAPTSINQVEQLAAADWIRHLTTRLPESQRRALDLQLFCQMSAVEIAEQLDVTPATVRKHLERGRRRLKKIIEQESPSS